MSYFTKIKNFIQSHYIISAIAGIVIIFIIYKAAGGGSVKKELYTVSKGDVVQKVIVTGKTKPAQAVELGFENSGKVARSSVVVGSRVYAGQQLASLDASETYADLLKAQANLQSEEANFDEVKGGTRPEEIAIAQTTLDNAKISLTDAQSNISAKMTDSYSKADDAIHNYVDSMFSNPRTSNPQINLTVTDSQLKSDANSGRFAVEKILNDWKILSTSMSKSDVVKAQAYLSQVKAFVDIVASAVNSSSASSNISQTTLDGYKTSVSTARTNVLTAISNLTSAYEKVNTAEATVTSAERSLSLKQNGSTPEAVRIAEAKVMQMKAGVDSVQAQLGKMTLYSPIAGIVTRMDAKAGEIVTPGKTVISVISDSDLQIESNVSEISVGKVSVGNLVDITLDAFPGNTFYGSVTYIEPAETIVDGVVNYKVTIVFNEKYPQMKSGLTTNLDIKTNVKNDVLRVPQYSLIKKADGSVFVSKKSGNSFAEVPVTIGLVGQDGFAEVLSGLSEGDMIEVVATK